MIVNLAPQSVQLVNGYEYLRSIGWNISFRHGPHMAKSLGMATPRSPFSLFTILNPIALSSVSGSPGPYSTRSSRANGGRALLSSRMKRSGSQSTSMTTFEPLFWTYPWTPRAVATRCTVGLKPTPWTIPWMVILIDGARETDLIYHFSISIEGYG